MLHGLSIKLDLFYVYKLYAILEEMKSFNLGLNQFEVTFDHRIGRSHNFVIVRNFYEFFRIHILQTLCYLQLSSK